MVRADFSDPVEVLLNVGEIPLVVAIIPALGGHIVDAKAVTPEAQRIRDRDGVVRPPQPGPGVGQGHNAGRLSGAFDEIAAG